MERLLWKCLIKWVIKTDHCPVLRLVISGGSLRCGRWSFSMTTSDHYGGNLVQQLGEMSNISLTKYVLMVLLRRYDAEMYM